MRGLRTLHLRQERQSASAMALAQKLSAHPLVAPRALSGLPQHPGHDIAARQMENGFGYMLSVQVTAARRRRSGRPPMSSSTSAQHRWAASKA